MGVTGISRGESAEPLATFHVHTAEPSLWEPHLLPPQEVALHMLAVLQG